MKKTDYLLFKKNGPGRAADFSADNGPGRAAYFSPGNGPGRAAEKPARLQLW
jgi:hypothetical protein